MFYLIEGCGRKNWDGTGGNGHALQHFQETGAQYPLCVKLGTITAAGGDVYSYAPDEDDSKIDPHLGVHLAHFSINIMTLQKTEKSTAELTVNLNQLYDFSKYVMIYPYCVCFSLFITILSSPSSLLFRSCSESPKQENSSSRPQVPDA